MKSIGFSVALLLFLSGCAGSTKQMLGSMYNQPSSGTSKFDGTKHVRVTKIACSDGVMLELYQDTPKHQAEKVLLTAGVTSAKNIGRSNSLEFNVDGTRHTFDPVRATTNIDSLDFGHRVRGSFSSKPYVVSESFVRDVAGADRVAIRIHLLDGSYADGLCSELTMDEAKEMPGVDPQLLTQDSLDASNSIAGTNGFSMFVEMIDSTEW